MIRYFYYFKYKLVHTNLRILFWMSMYEWERNLAVQPSYIFIETYQDQSYYGSGESKSYYFYDT